MSEEDKSKQLERVRKLLAKAEDPATTPEEAEALNSKAAELIAKYGVEAALLSAVDKSKDEIEHRTIWVENPYVQDKRELYSWGIATPLGIQTVWHNVSGRGKQSELRITAIGWKSDLDRAEVLFTSLLVQIAYGAAQTKPEPETDHYTGRPIPPSPARVRAYRKSWMRGFTSAVARRLRAAEQRAQIEAKEAEDKTLRAIGASTPGVELVLRNREELVEAEYTRSYPKLGKPVRRRLGNEGYSAGVVAGERANLNMTPRTEIGR